MTTAYAMDVSTATGKHLFSLLPGHRMSAESWFLESYFTLATSLLLWEKGLKNNTVETAQSTPPMSPHSEPQQHYLGRPTLKQNITTRYCTVLLIFCLTVNCLYYECATSQHITHFNNRNFFTITLRNIVFLSILKSVRSASLLIFNVIKCGLCKFRLD